MANTLKYGVYAYVDSNGDCIYIGYDSNIQENKRHKDHYAPSNIDHQKINKILQTGEYTYIVISTCYDKEIMMETENMLIHKWRPIHNVKKRKV